MNIAAQRKGTLLNGRQIIWFVYLYHETNSQCQLADSIEDLMAVRLVGNNLKRFFDRWRVILSGILERPNDKTLEAFFVRQLRTCDHLQLKKSN